MGSGLIIGELFGGGLVLGYGCPSRCRHCLYGCGPHRSDGEPDDALALENLLDLVAERAPEACFHIGGGEPFLDVDRLSIAVEGLVKRGIALDYVETNAAWVKDQDQAEHILEKLARRGLEQVLISVSPFHAEFIPVAKVRILRAAADRVLANGACLWLPELLRDLGESSGDDRLEMDAFLASHGNRYARSLGDRYNLVPAGRAGRFLAQHGVHTPWKKLVIDPPCPSRLPDTTHFHVDGQGNYVPGLCAGIVLPMMAVPGEIDLSRYPVLRTLVQDGLAGLVDLASKEGFVPEHSYSSPCDLCTHARLYLYPKGYDELGPAGYYDVRSVSGYASRPAHVSPHLTA